MRFATVFLTGAFAAFASAQSPTTSAYAGQTSQQAAIAKCLAACESGDVNCTSKCIAVPNPDAAMVNETNRCVAACPKGNGSAAESKAYGECMQGCIDKNFFTSTRTPSVPTAGAGVGGNGNGNGNDNDNGNGNGGDNNENKPTGTGTDGTPTGTGTAAQNTNAAVKAGAGMVGLAVMGLLAL